MDELKVDTMADSNDSLQAGGIDRRSFFRHGAVGLASGGVVDGAANAQQTTPSDPRTRSLVSLKINGKPYRLEVEPRVTLLDALREVAQLTGTKKGCNHGQCGACTVLVDGKRVVSCLTLAHMVDGREVTTIEGVASMSDSELHPMQEAFIEHDAFQCGFCTPGQIVSGIGCVKEGHIGDDAEIREYMSGNLCRCSAYPNIVEAVKDAAGKM